MGFLSEPSVGGSVVLVVWPSKSEEDVYVQKCGSHAGSSARSSEARSDGIIGASGRTVKVGSPEGATEEALAFNPRLASAERMVPSC